MFDNLHTKVILITLLLSVNRCLPCAKLETMDANEVQGVGDVGMETAHLQKHAHILARFQRWLNGISSKPDIHGVEITHPEADVYIQQWLNSISWGKGRVGTRYANVPHGNKQKALIKQ